MASLLALVNESNLLQDPANLLARKTGRQFHQSANACHYFNVFKRIHFGNRITRQAAILDVKFNCFTDVCQGLLPAIPLGDTSRQYRDRDDKTAIGFAFQYNCVFHRA